MKSLWRLDRPAGRTPYESVIAIPSKAMPGVTFSIQRISFGRRMELSRRVREISQKLQYLEAGSELQEKIEAGILAQEVDALYLSWALVSIDGLEIDGTKATPAQLIEKGPEDLTREIIGEIRRQCGLTEGERKN